MPSRTEVEAGTGTGTGTDAVSTGDFEQAVDNLVVASKQPAKHRTYQVSALLTTIIAYAYQQGIPAPTLSVVLGTVTRLNHLDQSSRTTLIKGLYPNGRVPASDVYIVVNSLGQGKEKPSPATQNLLLRWVFLVIEVLEDPSILERTYSVLFNLLDTISLRANLCQILTVITRRKHVKPFRIQKLLELSAGIGNEPALLGLLRTYKEFYPDVVVSQATAKIARFTHPDTEWRDRLRIIQDTNLRLFQETQLQTSAFKVVRQGAKRSRVAVVPEVHTYRAAESSTALEEVNGVHDFVQKLDSIQLPNQMVSVLDDPLLQHFVLLRGNDISEARVDQWLALFFDTQLQLVEESGQANKSLVEMLEKVLRYTRRTKILPKSVQVFITKYLPLWDGQENRTLILNMLAYLPITSFQDLQIRLFNHLEDAILDNTDRSAMALLEYYTTLLRHWTTQLLAPHQPPHPSRSSQTTSLATLVSHASLLSLTLLTSYPPTQCSLSATLSYHETLAHTISHAPTHAQIRILTPIPQTIYLLAFLSPTLSTLSRLCSILATYKRAFEATMTNPPPGSTHEYPREFVNSFNGFLMDICNLLWRSRAFNTTDTNALGCLLPPSTVSKLRTYVEMLLPPQSLSTLFSLSHNPTLCAVSIAAFRNLETKAIKDMSGEEIETRHAGPVTQRSLANLGVEGGVKVGWAEYRLEVLRWLGDRGVGGVGELMFCTMKHLMQGQGAAKAG